MWERIRRELLIEYYWWKRHKGKKRRLDSPLGGVGILLISLGIFVLVIIGQIIMAFFRCFVPMVSGAQMAGAYWSVVFLAIKVSFFLLLLLGGLIIILFLKLTGKKR
ncbi:MAG TPA: hypothetical protein GXX46_03565 [Peptococcaceae bacterium]|nr:hypothetical protein [Peptococcaceae bacterium]